MLSCTAACECTEATFETACAPRPCERLAGCAAGQCRYEPVSCGAPAAACGKVACEGAGCELVCTPTAASCDGRVYACGGAVCAGVTAYCDPSPTVQNGKVVYANACVGPPTSGCGTCGLGRRTCDTGADRFTCQDVPSPVNAGASVECDSTASASTFLYVDTQYQGGGSDGSRARPFTTYEAARDAAVTRNARAVVIAGSPVITTPLVVASGVSVYGGYGPAPRFEPQPAQRPVWDVPPLPANLANNQLVAARAQNITLRTVLSHLEVRAGSVAGLQLNGHGASSIALLALSAPQLVLDDVNLVAGAAGAGAAGQAPAATGAAHHGGVASGRAQGAVGSACAAATPACNVSPVPTNQSGATCGLGGQADASSGIYRASAGNAGTPNPTGTGSVPGGAAGAIAIGNNCPPSPTPTVGIAGSPGLTGAAGGQGAAGQRGNVSAQGVWTPVPATSGTAGGRGTWGGGGGAGGGDNNTESCGGGQIHPGGPGGGGGGPGCGGDFGRAGGAGGASIALAAVSSTGLQVRGGTFTTGAAGAGGAGSAGAAGGSGGNGETRTTALCPANPNLNRGRCGGAGGRGGNGGGGGAGGGGAGGDSVGVLCVGTTALTREALTLSPGAAGAAGGGPVPGQAGQALQTRGCP
jgi:hypothetical protein